MKRTIKNDNITAHAVEIAAVSKDAGMPDFGAR